jgi:hypothetical protein
MPEPPEVMESIAGQIGDALISADLDAFSDLLDPNAHWGEGRYPRAEGCTNRKEVLKWYRQARAAGVRALVTATEIRGDQILVGLSITGRDEPERWQVLTVRDSKVIDIAGFEDRAHAEVALTPH